MKLRRVFALLSAFALALSMSFSAFATTTVDVLPGGGGTDVLPGGGGETHAPSGLPDQGILERSDISNPSESPGNPIGEHIWDYWHEMHHCTRDTHSDFLCVKTEAHTFGDDGACTVCGYLPVLPPAAAPAPPINDPATWVVDSTTVNATSKVYSQPNPNSATGTVLTVGTALPVLDWTSTNGFIKVSVEGSVSYVTKSALKSSGTPIVEAPARELRRVKADTVAGVFASKDINSTPYEYVLACVTVDGTDLGDGWFQRSSDSGYIWRASLE